MAANFHSRFRSLTDSALTPLGRPMGKAVIIGLLAAILGLAVSYLPVGSNLEVGIGLPLLFTLRGERKAPPQVVVVAIDKASTNRLGLPANPQQWPRSYHAGLVKKLIEKGARVIVFDLFFGKWDAVEDDARFAQAIGAAHNVVLLGYLKKSTIPLEDQSGRTTGEMTVETLASPDSVLAQQAESVAAFPLPMVPLTVSQVWTFKSDSGDFPTMPVTAFQLYAMPAYRDLIALMKTALEDPVIARTVYDEHNRAAIVEARKLVSLRQDTIVDTHRLHALIRSLRTVLGHHTILSRIMMSELEHPRQFHAEPGTSKLLKGLVDLYSTGSSRYLNFYGPAHTIPTVLYDQVLEQSDPAVNGAPIDFKNKIVFIGSSDFSPFEQTDTYSTVFSKPNGQNLSGVEICATAVANLIEDNPVRPMGGGATAVTFVIFGLTAAVICVFLRPIMAAVCGVGLVVVYIGFAYVQFIQANVWSPVVIPAGFQAPFAFVAAVLWKYRDARKVEVAHQQLKELDRLKSMFLSHVSHELKTPLTSIKGFVDNMLDGVTGALQGRQQEYLTRVRINADRLTRMITNLLDLSRIESGTHRLDLGRLWLFDVVDEVVSLLRPIAASKQLTLDIVCNDPTIQIVADRDKLIQVMTNMTDNAIKFTPVGGKITVAITRADPDRVMITVTDTGEGIPADVIPQLFQPFYQASRQPGAHAKGLGLGLSIAKTLVELHGGTISVTSEVGKGTQFCVLLPAATRVDG
jgi:signal transduction histidine kinase